MKRSKFNEFVERIENGETIISTEFWGKESSLKANRSFKVIKVEFNKSFELINLSVEGKNDTYSQEGLSIKNLRNIVWGENDKFSSKELEMVKKYYFSRDGYGQRNGGIFSHEFVSAEEAKKYEDENCLYSLGYNWLNAAYISAQCCD
jgi:hypothetical protein